MLENLDKIMHLRFNFDACPMHSPFGFVHLTHQNLSARALFRLNSLTITTHADADYSPQNVPPGGVTSGSSEEVGAGGAAGATYNGSWDS